MRELKINQEIRAPEVMLIDENGQSQGVVSLDQALYLAYEVELDLVEVNPGLNPPVVKIMDYGKYRYTQEKLEQKQKSKSKGPELKEIRLSLKISSHDLDFKTIQAQKFLADNNKVKVTVRLIGREMMFRQKAYEMVNKFRDTLNAKYESPVERMGNQFSGILVKK